MPSMTYVAAFRTHFWDEAVAELAQRFSDQCQNGKFVVVADETNGVIDCAPFEKVSHTADSTQIKLPLYPEEKHLWYNGDYPLYYIRKQLPDFHYYIMAENDVSVNTNMDNMIEQMHTRNIDLLAQDIRPMTDRDGELGFEQGKFADLWRAMIMFMAVSGKAIDAMYELRLQHAKIWMTPDKEGLPTNRRWSWCERFIPSAVKAAGLNFEKFDQYFDCHHINVEPIFRVGNPYSALAGTILHPVYGDKKFTDIVLSRNIDPNDYWNPESYLSRTLRYETEDYKIKTMCQKFLGLKQFDRLLQYLLEVVGEKQTSVQSQ